MASISGQDTKPEILVRSFLFGQGFRFRKNVKSLSGKPDIVLSKHKAAIFIHGCFWHGHNCKRAARPTSNVEFWNSKIQSNIERDKRVKSELKKLGWRTIVIWNCQLGSKVKFSSTMTGLLKKLK